MKIRLSELRRIIRAVVEEQSVVPGKWDPVTGEPLHRDDVALMGTGGMGHEDHEDEELDEADTLEEKKKKRGLWANIHAKRKRGEPPAKPGEEGYPKTLDI